MTIPSYWARILDIERSCRTTRRKPSAPVVGAR